MEFSRQEYWSGLQFPSPGDLPDLRIKPMFPALAGGFSTTEPPGKPIYIYIYIERERERVYVYDTYMFLLLIRCIVIIRFLTVFITLKSPELVI